MSWTYNLKVNLALGSMTIDPRRLNPDWAFGIKQIGEPEGLTPQETALAIVGFVFEHKLDIPDAVELAIGVWRKSGKISISKPEVVDALRRLGYAI
jgi:hypothetical protein